MKTNLFVRHFTQHFIDIFDGLHSLLSAPHTHSSQCQSNGNLYSSNNLLNVYKWYHTLREELERFLYRKPMWPRSLSRQMLSVVPRSPKSLPSSLVVKQAKIYDWYYPKWIVQFDQSSLRVGECSLVPVHGWNVYFITHPAPLSPPHTRDHVSWYGPVASGSKGRWCAVVLMLGQRRRRWTNIKTTGHQRLVSKVTSQTGHCTKTTVSLWKVFAIGVLLFCIQFCIHSNFKYSCFTFYVY